MSYLRCQKCGGYFGMVGTMMIACQCAVKSFEKCGDAGFNNFWSCQRPKGHDGHHSSHPRQGDFQKTTTEYRAQFGLGPNQAESYEIKGPTYISRTNVLEAALRDIGNKSGAPTMRYSPEVERQEQAGLLVWINARVAEALKASKQLGELEAERQSAMYEAVGGAYRAAAVHASLELRKRLIYIFQKHHISPKLEDVWPHGDAVQKNILALTPFDAQAAINEIKRAARLAEAEHRPHDESCKTGEWMGNYTSGCTCGKDARIAELEKCDPKAAI